MDMRSFFLELFIRPATFQSASSTAWGLVLLFVLAVALLLGLGYWVVGQWIATFKQPASKPTRPPQKKKATPPPKEPVSKNISAPGPTEGKPEASAWVKEEYPDALLMDAKTLVKEYQAGRRNFQSVYPSAVGPYETFLKWTVLDGIDLSRAMLYRAPFDGTSLLDANFNGAYLEGVSFRGAILRRANLNWADLSGADLSGADLTGANLSYATLQGADLTKAKLTGAIVTPEQLEQVRSLKEAILPDGQKFEE